MADSLIINQKVAYFTGCFTNYYYPEAGEATFRVLARNGVETVLPDQVCCALPMMAKGNIQGAYRNIEFNIKSLSKAITSGYAIITTCSSCALMIKRDYPRLIGSELAQKVARNCYYISEYLLKLSGIGKLQVQFQLSPQTIFYHTPCHLRALGIGSPTVDLLNLVPGISIRHVSRECCGMGGAYGYEKANYALSKEIAAKLFSEIKENPSSRVVTDCGGCKLQIESVTGTRADHPMILLQEAYFASSSGIMA